MKIEYSSNNSGGNWWLKDKDWKALESEGWHVVWGGYFFCHPDPAHTWSHRRSSYPCLIPQDCPGHRQYETWQEADQNRHLGALARCAHKDFPSMRDAILEWEEIIGLDSSSEGCGCCGPPHNFNTKDEEEYESVYGPECATVLYDNAPSSYREALAELDALRKKLEKLHLST